MEKKTINVHAFTIHIYSILVVALIVLAVILGLKYAHLKLAMDRYTQGTIMMNQNATTARISDYAIIIGVSAQNLTPAQLQNYVSSVSTVLNRDVVIVDNNKKILADTVASNIGSTYSFDLSNEIEKTIEDGQVRGFEEKSTDYPNGISQVIVAMQDSGGVTVGAVIISNNLLPEQ